MEKQTRQVAVGEYQYIDSKVMMASTLPKKYSEAEFGNAMARIDPKSFAHLNTGEPVPDALKNLGLSELQYYKIIANRYKTVKSVTPFNVVEGVTSRKGKMTPEIDIDGSGKIDVVVNNQNVALVVNKGVIDPTPLTVAGIEVTKFNQGKYRVATLLSTMFDCVDGEAKVVTIAKSANEVFRISDIVLEGTMKLTLERNLTIFIKNNFDDLEINYKGVKFAELLYTKFIETKDGGKGFNTLCANINSVMAKNKKNDNYITASQGSLMFNAPTLRFTKKINGEPFEYNKKTASLPQLLYTLDAARNIRGENQGERGGHSRNAYMLYDVEPKWAEITYWATELHALRLPERFRLLADVSATNKIREVLLALRLVKYDGEIVFKNDYPLSSIAKKKDKKYIVTNADYKLIQMSTKDFESDKSLVVDLRAISYKETTIADTMSKMQEGLENREFDLAKYGSKFILHGPVMENMFPDLDIYTGVRIHNGVCYYLKGHKIDNPNVVFGGKSRGHIFYSGICANIARTYRVYLLRHTHTLMKLMGCVLSVTPVAIFPLCSDEYEETQEELDFDSIKILDEGDIPEMPLKPKIEEEEADIDFDKAD